MRLLIGCLSFALMLAAPSQWLIQAHGLGEQQLERVETGPFRLSAWTDPISPNTDEPLHVTVAVENADGLVRNVNVMVNVTAQDDENISFEDRATHERAVNKLQYEAQFELTSPGTYDVVVSVENEEGNGTATFSLTIAAGDGISISPGWVAASIAGASLLILVVWNRVQLARRRKE